MLPPLPLPTPLFSTVHYIAPSLAAIESYPRKREVGDTASIDGRIYVTIAQADGLIWTPIDDRQAQSYSSNIVRIA